MTTEMAMNDVQMPSEVSSHLSTSVGKSKSNFRLFIFTALSVLACMAALANVAAAAAPSGEDQYLEKAPTGSGDSNDTDENGFEPIDANGDGTISGAEVKEAARKKAKAKKDKADEEGTTGASGAAAGSSTPPTPPPVQSVATAAKFGPFSQTTAIILAIFAALIAALAIASKAGVITLFGSGGSQPPPA